MTTATLARAAGQLVLVDARGVALAAAGGPPALFVAEPPTDRASWEALRARLLEAAPPFAGDDFAAMLAESTQPDTTPAFLRGATAGDLRLEGDGFALPITLPEGGAPGVAWAAGLPAGSYLVRYTLGAGYTAQPLTPAAIAPPRVRREVLSGDTAVALSPTTIVVNVPNEGGLPAERASVALFGSLDGAPDVPIGAVEADVPGGGVATARLVWVPRAPGRWSVRARVTAADGTSVTGEPFEVVVAAPPAAGLWSLVAAQRAAPLAALAAIGAVLASAAGLVATLSLGLWTRPVPGQPAAAPEADGR